jgi:hypothetical protein
MSDMHRITFERFLRGVDQGEIGEDESSNYQKHLSACPDCSFDFSLYHKLRAEAALLWPVSISPRRSTQQLLDGIHKHTRRQRRQRMLFFPIRLIAWGVMALILLIVVNWVFSSLRSQPAEAPMLTDDMAVISSTEALESTPQVNDVDIDKIPLQPLAVGLDILGGRDWSPDGKYYFFTMVEPSEDPQSDRVYTILNFLNVETGQVCRHPQQILGRIGFSQPHWLPDGRLLFTSEFQGVQLYTPCQEQVENLDHRFSESILSLPAFGRSDAFILLQGERRYWLLDKESLQVQSLAGLVTSPDGTDRLVWSPFGDKLAIYQTGANLGLQDDSLTIIEVESGMVLQSIQISSDSESGAGMLDWLLEDKLLVWTFSSEGPILIVLVDGQPKIVNVMKDLMGLDINYPYDISASAYIANETTGNFRFLVRTNTSGDDELLIYRSETGEVVRWTEDVHYYLFFSDGNFVFMNRWEVDPPYIDDYHLIWVDDLNRAPQSLVVEGHSPRNYPILWPRLLPGGEQIALGSSQGVSLVSLPDGQLLNFWSLESEGEPHPSLYASPDGRFIVVTTQFQKEEFAQPSSALYLIQLQP